MRTGSANRTRPHMSREGGRLSTGCSQPVEISPAPFQPLPVEGASTKRILAKGSDPGFLFRPEGLLGTMGRSAPDDFCVQDDPRLR